MKEIWKELWEESEKYLKLYKRNFKGRSVRLRTITRAATAARCTWARSRRWAIREHCKEPSGKVSTLWTYSPSGAPCFGLCPIRLIGAAAAAFLRLHCGLNSVAFFLDVAGLVALKLLQNGATEHEPCIFKFFLLPRLETRIKEFKIKESVVVCQTSRRGKKLNENRSGVCGRPCIFWVTEWTISVLSGIQIFNLETRKKAIYSWSKWSQRKLWWKFKYVMTCKSMLRIVNSGERLIELFNSWFNSKFLLG